MKYCKLYFMMMMLLFFIKAQALFSITAEEILSEMDKNKKFKSAEMTAVMEIHTRKKMRFKEMVIKISEKGRVLVEFINIEDKGTKYLKIDDELWIYFPEEEETVKISGHMLKQGMMGSDISYRDALEKDLLTNKYNIKIDSEIIYNKRECYVLILDAMDFSAPYAKRKMYVDKETYVTWKEEMYSTSGKLLKTYTAIEVKKIDDIYFITHSETSSTQKKNSKTVLIVKEVVLNPVFDSKIFSKKYLSR